MSGDILRMSDITLIIGLPSSGKTEYAKHPKFSDCMKFDDPFLHYRFPESFIDDTNTWALAACLLHSRNVLVNDPHLCNITARQQFIGWLFEHSCTPPCIKLIFFENDSEQCVKNSKLNQNKEVERYINHLSTNYHIPLNHTILPVYAPQ